MKFQFPFIVCARLNKKEAILSGLSAALTANRQSEMERALGEIKKICRLRVEMALAQLGSRIGGLTSNM